MGTIPRRLGFCKQCESRVMLSWHEPSHVLFSLLTLALIGGGFVTPWVGGFMLAAWAGRILATAGWGCSCCGGATVAVSC